MHFDTLKSKIKKYQAENYLLQYSEKFKQVSTAQ